MLFVPSESKVLQTAIADGLEGDFHYCEFGAFEGTVSIAKGKLTITLRHPSITQIDTRLKAKYESFVEELTASHQQIRLDNMDEIAKLRRNILAAPIESAIGNQEQGRPTPKQKTVLKASSGESMWVIGHEDRVVIIQSIRLAEETVKTLSATFFKELVDTRALPAYQSAPSVSVSQDLPPELEGEQSSPDTVNFEPAKRQKAIDRMVHLREYYYAHLRAAKMYLHSRMRAKTADMTSSLKSMSLKKAAPQSKTFRYTTVFDDTYNML